jgi:ABC-type nickel/cobalt efflux system permease component RcnA
MIESNPMLWLEVCALTVLVGVGIWRIYRTQQSATISASEPVSHDMRQDGQRLNLQNDPR